LLKGAFVIGVVTNKADWRLWIFPERWNGSSAGTKNATLLLTKAGVFIIGLWLAAYLNTDETG
jgi:hypothetical protein